MVEPSMPRKTSIAAHLGLDHEIIANQVRPFEPRGHAALLARFAVGQAHAAEFFKNAKHGY